MKTIHLISSTCKPVILNMWSFTKFIKQFIINICQVFANVSARVAHSFPPKFFYHFDHFMKVMKTLSVTRSAKINHVSTHNLTRFFKFFYYNSCSSHANKTQFFTTHSYRN